MNPNISPDPRNSSGERTEAEETLRLLATLPPPEGMTDRVHRRLAEEKSTPRRRWVLWMASPRLQFAGAAVAVAALATGGWTLYQSNRSQPLVPGVHAPAQGSFSTGGAVRQPPTLTPMHVPPAPKKKPAAQSTAKTSSKAAANSAAPATK